jgi:hypothetical protein
MDPAGSSPDGEGTRGIHVGELEHLNSHQRDTMAQIFNQPLSHNIEWHAVISLLNAVATVRETHKGHVLVTLGDASETFDPQRHKDIDAEQLTILRRLLRQAGYGPGETTQ